MPDHPDTSRQLVSEHAIKSLRGVGSVAFTDVDNSVDQVACRCPHAEQRGDKLQLPTCPDWCTSLCDHLVHRARALLPSGGQWQQQRFA